MEITPLGYSPHPMDIVRKAPAAPAPNAFGEMLSEALHEVNRLQNRADSMATEVALGKETDVHDAVLAAEEASLAFQYTLQLRNRMIEAYQEIMRMQV